MDDNTPMPFGIHKGKKLANVPPKYLIWLYETGMHGQLKEYIEDNLDVLKKQVDYENKSKNK